MTSSGSNEKAARWAGHRQRDWTPVRPQVAASGRPVPWLSPYPALENPQWAQILPAWLYQHSALKTTRPRTAYEHKIWVLNGYAIRSGRCPHGSQRPQGGMQAHPGHWLPGFLSSWVPFIQYKYIVNSSWPDTVSQVPPGPIREIEGFVMHICVTREMRAVFHDAYMQHQVNMS